MFRLILPNWDVNIIAFFFRSSRYWTTEECGIAAIIVFVFYFILGRLSERQIGRSYERELTEASQGPKFEKKYGMLDRMSYFFQWLWDITCPLFLQQQLYLSPRNRRSHEEVLNNVIFLRSEVRRDRSSFNASSGRGRMRVEVPDRELGLHSHLVGVAFFLLSFSACSPHFGKNCLRFEVLLLFNFHE